MGHRLTKIYTRTGDDGTTVLGDGTRIDKSALRIAVMGDIVELNSLIGILLAHDVPDGIKDHLQDIQHKLFDLGGELSLPDTNILKSHFVEDIEKIIDDYNEELPPLKEFILPGGSMAASICHLSRTVCRRAERQLIKLGKTESINQHSQIYLNRISDLLFVLARILARQDGGKEVYWQKDR